MELLTLESVPSLERPCTLHCTFPGVTCFTLAFVQYESECPKTTIILTPKHRSEIPTEGRWVYDYDTFESEIEVKPYDGVHFIFD